MTPLYQLLNQNMPNNYQQPQMTQQMSGGMQFANPVQRANFIMQAMMNPAAFVKQNFPDIPDQISNNPGMILRYLQQTRGITNQQIQQLYNNYGGQQ